MPDFLADSGIFKAYDIRGKWEKEIDADAFEAIGRAFVRVLSELEEKPAGELRVGLGRDMRLQAPEAAGRMRDGMVAEGAEVIDAGQIGTEMLYFLVGSRGLDGGAMVTASHNPKAYIGAKLIRSGALALSGDAGIGEIRDLVRAEGDSGLGEAPGGGSVTEIDDLFSEFHDYAAGLVDLEGMKPFKVVVDGGNGMAGPMVGPLLERMGLDLVTTYWEPDGNFPDHEPNPLLPENREFIVRRIKEEGADLGIAWDGDADRCFFFDSEGEFVDGDFLTALLARQVLEKEPGARILYDVRASRAVRDTVAELGGTSDTNRVGHAFFKVGLREQDAAFGGEVSGHYYFRDFWCADSGTLPALYVLELLSNQDKNLAELVAEYRSEYFISSEINSEVEDAEGKMEELVATYGPDGEGGEVDRLDGVSVDFDDWHFNVRPSNTEPLLRLNLESVASREDMERRRDELLEQIRS
ncbi:phosphomannomutase/phosphoglucomutase [Thermoleophilia bacterium SCSIO 60948]|nr:phosphomannomutase/phosphoglucomutase [Thermoleophilia bacterium SCSIO 60948]